MSYLTDDELRALEDSSLDPFTPYVLEETDEVTEHRGTYFYRGAIYELILPNELIRDDVIRWVTRRREDERKAERKEIEAQQMEML